MTKRSVCSLLSLLIALASAQAWAATTSPTVNRLALRVFVTAIQGGAQYRVNSEDKWQMLKSGADLREGVEFRTGPRGAIQFTVGTDQVFRVDRLTVVKVLRAALMADGTIKTDVGMTYGRISKDVDQPARPHVDTIVSPAATLAVRGTHVSLYDQPPYNPEAISLIGNADYGHHHQNYVNFGTETEGAAKVGDNADSSFVYMWKPLPTDPNGIFDGRTPPEQTLIDDGGSLYGTPVGIFGHTSSFIGGQLISDSLIPKSPVAGQLDFELTWSASGSSPLSTVVNFVVTGPNGQVVSPALPGPVASGGFYVSGSSTLANGSGAGAQTIQWGSSYLDPTSTYPPGTYKITETLKGTLTQTLAQNPSAAVLANTVGIVYNPSGTFSLVDLGTTLLNAAHPTKTFLFPVAGVGAVSSIHAGTNPGVNPGVRLPAAVVRARVK